MSTPSWPAAAIGLPVLTLDELDKAAGDRLAIGLRLLQGDSVISWEGETFTMPATVLCTFNAGKDHRAVLLPDRIRSMVMLNTSGLASLAACQSAARALLRPGALPVLDAGRLTPSTQTVADDVAELLGAELSERMVPGARALVPAEGLALIVPGPHGQRWRATGADVCGVVLFDDARWPDIEVRAIVAAALALEPTPARPALALVRGFG